MGLNWKSKARLLIRHAGIDVHRYRPNESIDARRCLIMKRLDIELVFDVGANTGQYAKRIRTAGYKGRIVSFEPTSDAFARLRRAAAKDDMWDCFNLALGESVTKAEIGVAGNSHSSSLLPMSRMHKDAEPLSTFVDRETVQIERLENFVQKVPEVPQRRLLLKIDTQGFELAVLKGAGPVIDETAVVEVELSLFQLYEGQPLFREVIDYLDGFGFSLVSLDPGFSNPGTGHLLQVDGIFVRSDHA